MSDLKHRTADELRRVIRSSETYRASLQASWEKAEVEAAELLKLAADRRQKFHNAGQREVWARIYLARKETGSDAPADAG